MLIKFINPHIRFRNISEADFTSIGFDGQQGIRLDTTVMPFVDLPTPVAQWLLDNEPNDWAIAEMPATSAAADEAAEVVEPDSADVVELPSAADADEVKSSKKK